MNKKLKNIFIILGIIVILVLGIFIGKFIFKDRNPEFLDGIYLTEKTYTGVNGNAVTNYKMSSITFYKNNTVSLNNIYINELKGLGISVQKGTTGYTGTYTLSNETNTILITYYLDNGNQRNMSLTFNNGYKELKADNETYNLIKGNLDDNIPKSTYTDERNVEFAGVFKNETIINKSTSKEHFTYKGKELKQSVSKSYYEFFNDGHYIYKAENENQYADGTDEIMQKWENKKEECRYSIDKENNVIYLFENATFERVLTVNDDFKEITDTEGKIYK